MNKDKVYVVFRKSGRVMDFRSGTGTHSESKSVYLSILEEVAREQMSGGSDYDRPDKLFLNGECVVPERLSDLAWNYHADLRAAQYAARKKANQLHEPEWLPEEERSVFDATARGPVWKSEKVR